MSSTRQEIARKIDALLAKKVEVGCTEEEAHAALELANKLKLQYDIGLQSVKQAEAEDYVADLRPFATGKGQKKFCHPVVQCCHNIAQFSDCKWWLQRGNLVFFGTKYDAGIAWHLVETLRESMDNCWGEQRLEFQRHKVKHGLRVHGKTARKEFMLGMAMRLNTRLEKLKLIRDTSLSRTNFKVNLVVVRNDILTERYDEYMHVNQLSLAVPAHQTAAGVVDMVTYDAGKQRGDEVDLDL